MDRRGKRLNIRPSHFQKAERVDDVARDSCVILNCHGAPLADNLNPMTRRMVFHGGGARRLHYGGVGGGESVGGGEIVIVGVEVGGGENVGGGETVTVGVGVGVGDGVSEGVGDGGGVGAPMV